MVTCRIRPSFEFASATESCECVAVAKLRRGLEEQQFCDADERSSRQEANGMIVTWTRFPDYLQ